MATKKQDAGNVATPAETVSAGYAKILAYGDSGVGKTTSGALLDKVHFILTESQAEDHIRAINPNAIIHSVRRVEDIWPIISYLHELRASGHADGSEWVVMDTLSDFNALIINQILAAKQEKEPDKTPRTNQADWGYINSTTIRIGRDIRDLPYNTLCLCLSARDTNQETSERFVRPKFAGKTVHETICSLFGVVTYMYRETFAKLDADGKPIEKVVRLAMLDGDDHYISKPGRNLRPVERPDFAEWWKRMQYPIDVDALRRSMFGLEEEI